MTCDAEVTIGVLALQGAFIEHLTHFKRATASGYHDVRFHFLEVRTEGELALCDGLVIPGGESTAISLVAQRTELLEPLMAYIRSERPVWGTCAGLIFLAKEIEGGKPGQQSLGGIDVRVRRNAFGRQLDSFKADLDFSHFLPGATKFPTVFIRAPVISKILDGEESSQLIDQDAASSKVIRSKNNYQNPGDLSVLHQLEDGLIVAVRQGSKLGTSFHPELSDDYRFHKWFIDEFVLGRSSK